MDIESAYLIGLAQPGEQGRYLAEDWLDELALLAKTAGAEVLGRVIQSREHPDPRFYLGKGRAEGLAVELEEAQVDLVIADDELSTVQQRNLERVLGVRVVDRTEVILDIFAQRAKSREGKIQVELAQLKYLLPRLTGKGLSLSQQTASGQKGGIATRGPGETKLEMDRRRLRKRVSVLEKEAEAVRKHRGFQRQNRVDRDVFVIALAGYTNAGKSTLFNALTHAEVFTEDKLFATLDPTTRQLVRPGLRPCLLVDTVGFIQKLPTTLVKAFRATLEEIHQADLIWHVVDMSHPNRVAHLESVFETLAALDCQDTPQWVILNKVDLLKDPEAELASLATFSEYRCFPVSAITQTGLDSLLSALIDQAAKAAVL